MLLIYIVVLNQVMSEGYLAVGFGHMVVNRFRSKSYCGYPIAISVVWNGLLSVLDLHKPNFHHEQQMHP